AQEASYLFQEGDAEESYNLGTRTLECTKRMMGLKLWAAFMLYGSEKLGGLVEHVFGTAKRLAQLLVETGNFELLMQPQTNIVCFRHVPAGVTGNALNRHQESLRRQLVERGEFHLTQVMLNDQIWLRVTIMNPLTQESDLRAFLEKLDGQRREQP
ncbi:MAG TPA: pyridoxal-dependent decarboxylase, partial [Methylophilaceae bacterium]|nr:pyridoxal-dependent decarboxylase [Methylophilaceae bacterium]